MDAILAGDKTGIQAALAMGDKITDADASGWAPLMYAAGSYSSSGEGELLRGRRRCECTVEAWRDGVDGSSGHWYGR